MGFDLDNEELRATRKVKGLDKINISEEDMDILEARVFNFHLTQKMGNEDKMKKEAIRENQAIENLIKRNRELEADRDKLKEALGKRITYCNELEKDLFENCNNYVVPKSKIKEKIEVLKMEEHYDFIDNKKAIQILEELLVQEK